MYPSNVNLNLKQALWLSLLAVALLNGDCGSECSLDVEGERE